MIYTTRMQGEEEEKISNKKQKKNVRERRRNQHTCYILLSFFFVLCLFFPSLSLCRFCCQHNVENRGSNLVRHNDILKNKNMFFSFFPPRCLFSLDFSCTLEWIIRIIEHWIDQVHRMSSNFGRPKDKNIRCLSRRFSYTNIFRCKFMSTSFFVDDLGNTDDDIVTIENRHTTDRMCLITGLIINFLVEPWILK